jgi:heavy metal translocating P-type ATPase
MYQMTSLFHDRLNFALLGLALLGLVSGLAFWLVGQPDFATIAWTAGVVPVLAALCVEIARSLWKGEVGLDIVAALSMSAALLFGETLAAAVVALMYSGGTFLESFAQGRARREMSDLLSRVPRTATRHRKGALDEVPLDDIAPGDLLLIRQGDVAPVDGTVESASAMLDQSALTGESMPVRLEHGQEVMSGSTNAGEAFDLRVTLRAADSTYAGIVRLVEAAQKSKAPMARLADRYSLLFLIVTVTLATAAWWFTGDPIRAVAVLVVATPCPLILAVPVALVAGLSRAAHFGVLIKGAKPLEALARINTLILDKTGTLTDGRPQIVSIDRHGDMSEDEVLYFAAALDQASKHPIARAIVAAARARGIALPVPEDLVETPGEGVAGTVDGRTVVVGGAGFVATQAGVADPESAVVDTGSVVVSLAVDGRLMGHLVMADALRAGTGGLLAGLRRLGVARILLATGDRRAVAEAVTEGLGLDAVRADLTPQVQPIENKTSFNTLPWTKLARTLGTKRVPHRTQRPGTRLLLRHKHICCSACYAARDVPCASASACWKCAARSAACLARERPRRRTVSALAAAGARLPRLPIRREEPGMAHDVHRIRRGRLMAALPVYMAAQPATPGSKCRSSSSPVTGTGWSIRMVNRAGFITPSPKAPSAPLPAAGTWCTRPTLRR